MEFKSFNSSKNKSNDDYENGAKWYISKKIYPSQSFKKICTRSLSDQGCQNIESCPNKRHESFIFISLEIHEEIFHSNSILGEY